MDQGGAGVIDVIRQQFKPGMSPNQKINVTREFLQILCLKILSDKKYFDQIAFVGGTSLRVLFDLRRFSEDLDFSLIQKQKYAFDSIHRELLKAFHLYGLPCEAKLKTGTNVHSLLMKFTGILKELGLSELPDQKLSIKFEVDTNPPAGWRLANTIVNKMFMFNIVHYDLPSLCAGKLHACFCRKYTKGRDYYDLIWYLGKKIKPNLALLNNAIAQTEGKVAAITEASLKQYLLDQIQRVDFVKVKKDVERFLEDKSELDLFDAKTIQGTIESVY